MGAALSNLNHVKYTQTFYTDPLGYLNLYICQETILSTCQWVLIRHDYNCIIWNMLILEEKFFKYC